MQQKTIDKAVAVRKAEEAAKKVAASERTCVACRAVADRSEFVRLIEGPDGSIAVDPSGTAGGRGAWIHPSRKCLEVAAKRHAVERSLKIAIQPELAAVALIEQTKVALRRRREGLLSSAKGRRRVAVGAEAVEQAVLATKKLSALILVVVAKDAGEHTSNLAERLLERGCELRTVPSKADLGAWFARSEVAIAALLEPQIAQEFQVTLDRIARLET